MTPSLRVHGASVFCVTYSGDAVIGGNLPVTDLNCSLLTFTNQTTFPKMQLNTELVLLAVDPASQRNSPDA
eukprot:IDg17037t1